MRLSLRGVIYLERLRPLLSVAPMQSFFLGGNFQSTLRSESGERSPDEHAAFKLIGREGIMNKRLTSLSRTRHAASHRAIVLRCNSARACRSPFGRQQEVFSCSTIFSG
jgi:hypothetical protein